MANGIAASAEILGDIVDAPGFQPAARSAIQPRREPAVHRAAAIGLSALVRAEDVFGRVASAAMRRAGDQVAAAIPFRGFLLVRLEYAGPKEQIIPAAHHQAIVERPAQFRWPPLVAKRSKRAKIGADRQQVVAGEFGEIGVGEGRIIVGAIGRHAVA